MILDGIEVFYTMRNEKIVDPNIPTGGLVCYFDTRGKTNTDKHKGTLLDLSGNGNHRTLRNFNFTEESRDILKIYRVLVDLSLMG